MGKPQRGGDVSEVPSAAKAAGRGAGASCSTAWHCSEGRAGAFQALAVCTSRGMGKPHHFCFRGEVRNRAQGHQSNSCSTSLYSLNRDAFGWYSQGHVFSVTCHYCSLLLDKCCYMRV